MQFNFDNGIDNSIVLLSNVLRSACQLSEGENLHESLVSCKPLFFIIRKKN